MFVSFYIYQLLWHIITHANGDLILNVSIKMENGLPANNLSGMKYALKNGDQAHRSHRADVVSNGTKMPFDVRESSAFSVNNEPK